MSRGGWRCGSSGGESRRSRWPLRSVLAGMLALAARARIVGRFAIAPRSERAALDLVFLALARCAFGAGAAAAAGWGPWGSRTWLPGWRSSGSRSTSVLGATRWRCSIAVPVWAMLMAELAGLSPGHAGDRGGAGVDDACGRYRDCSRRVSGSRAALGVSWPAGGRCSVLLLRQSAGGLDGAAPRRSGPGDVRPGPGVDRRGPRRSARGVRGSRPRGDRVLRLPISSRNSISW